MTYKQQSNVNCEYRTLHNRELQLLYCQNQNYRKTHTSHLYPLLQLYVAHLFLEILLPTAPELQPLSILEKTHKKQMFGD